MITAAQVKEYLLQRYANELDGLGIAPTEVADDFDFLTQSVVDSLGVLDMISGIENRFQVTVDLEGLDAEQITILGPLTRYIEAHAVSKPGSGAAAAPVR